MSYDGSIREFPFKEPNQRKQGHFLFCCSSVLRSLVVGGEPSDVAYSDGVGVMPLAVRSYFYNIAPCCHSTVSVDDVVIPYGFESSLLMPSSDVLDGEILSFGSCRAMDDNLVYFSHAFEFYLILLCKKLIIRHLYVPFKKRNISKYSFKKTIPLVTSRQVVD